MTSAKFLTEAFANSPKSACEDDEKWVFRFFSASDVSCFEVFNSGPWKIAAIGMGPPDYFYTVVVICGKAKESKVLCANFENFASALEAARQLAKDTHGGKLPVSGLGGKTYELHGIVAEELDECRSLDTTYRLIQEGFANQPKKCPPGFDLIDIGSNDDYDSIPAGKHYSAHVATVIDTDSHPISFLEFVVMSTAPYQVYAFTPVGLLVSNPFNALDDALKAAQKCISIVSSGKFADALELKRAIKTVTGFRPKTIVIEAFANAPKKKKWIFIPVSVNQVKNSLPEATSAYYAVSIGQPNKVEVVYGSVLSTIPGYGYVIVRDLNRQVSFEITEGYFRNSHDPAQLANKIMTRCAGGTATAKDVAAIYGMEEIKL